MTKTEAEQKEALLIAEFKSNDREFGYNKSVGGECGARHGWKQTDEARQKISIANKGRGQGRKLSESTIEKIRTALSGRILSEEHIEKLSVPTGKAPKVNQYDLEGNFINQWLSGAHAAKTLNIQAVHIYHVCNGMWKTASGFIWLYDSDKDLLAERLKKLNTRRNIKPIIQLNKNNEIIQWWSCAREASEKCNITRSTISETCQGKRKTAGGYKWVYA